MYILAITIWMAKEKEGMKYLYILTHHENTVLNGKLVKKYGVPRGSLLRPKRYEAGL